MSGLVNFCTYFDHRFLSRGLAAYRSLARCTGAFRLWVLCLTEECHERLVALALPGLVPIRLNDLEASDPELRAAKSNRSMLEYYLTCAPAFMAWLLDSNSDVETITYIDADLYFFRDPSALIEEFRDHSTQITPHNYSARNQDHARYGIFNVGWLSFRHDRDGMECLRWWRKSCIEWCYDRVEPDRFLDQKYLDRFPEKFRGVQVLRQPGVNAGPWNLDNYLLGADDEGKPTLDGAPLICFHFSGLQRVARFVWRTRHRHFGVPLDRDVRRLLYAPYIAELTAADRLLRPLLRGSTIPLRRNSERGVPTRPLALLREVLRLAVRNEGIWVVAGVVL